MFNTLIVPSNVADIETPLIILGEIGVFTFLLLYVAFSIVMMRQVKLMTDTLEVGMEKLILAISYLHMVFAIGVLIFSLVLFFG